MEKKMWMVRAGKGSNLINDFLEKNVVAIGWREIGDISNATNKEDIKKLLRQTFPQEKINSTNVCAAIVSKFRFDLNLEDYVISYDSQMREYHVAKIVSGFEFKQNIIENMHFIRHVEWIGKVPRDSLTLQAKNTLGATLTIFEIQNSLQLEVLALLNNEIQTIIPEENNIIEEVEEIKEEVIEKAHEFIKDKLLSLTWDQMQELVAGLLTAMGYKARVSPKGPDRGRDIIASPDGLGLEEPRIVVEVKHRNGSMGSNEIRSFTGGLRNRDKGLYVSTGGFSKEAKYEAERSNIPISLIDADLLVDLIIQHYDNFDSEAKTLIPLKKIYWPV